MAKFYRNKNDIGYLKINFMELVEYSQNGFPICDECGKDLIGYTDVILIPVLNEAFCNSCGKETLAQVKDYAEDRAIRKKKEYFWKHYFKLEDSEVKE